MDFWFPNDGIDLNIPVQEDVGDQETAANNGERVLKQQTHCRALIQVERKRLSQHLT